MAGTPGNPQTLCLPYFTLRIIIGILGITLSFILSLGAWIFFGTGLQDSISEYYHTDMRDVFVGIIFIIGSFLITYRGYDIIDNIVSTIGGISAILAALFPASPGAATTVIGTLHTIFAALFFLALIYFALVLFPKTSPVTPPTPQKLQRNKVYKTCGWIMFICLVLLIIYSLLPNNIKSALKPFHLGFWLEAIAVIVFGFCWLTKGGGIWKDKIITGGADLTPH
jgi:hypothetical protein